MKTNLLTMRIVGLLMFIAGLFLGQFPSGAGLMVSGVVVSCTSLVLKEIRDQKGQS